MLRLLTLFLILVLIGCRKDLPSTSPLQTQQVASNAAEASETEIALPKYLSIGELLTRNTWTYESGAGAFTENWAFRFDPDGTYWFTLVSDHPHTPVKGCWTLTDTADGAGVLKLSGLERGSYYIIDQQSYPEYNDLSDTLEFPAKPGGNAVSFQPWIEFDWEHWREHYVPIPR